MGYRIPTEAVIVMIAAIGGLAKYMHEYMIAVHPKFVLSMLAANIITSGFSGFMFATLAEYMGLGERMIFVCAGLGGFASSATMDFIREMIVSRMTPPKL